MIAHLLRYDDYSSRSSFPVECALVDLLGELDYPCTFSVIPFVLDGPAFTSAGKLGVCPLSKEKVSLIRGLVDRGTIEIALHGWSHIALSSIRDFAEFSDSMPVDTQRRLIRDGRCCLEDLFQRSISLFVPPWNRLGRSTIEALKAEDLCNVSAGYPSCWEPDSPLGLEAAECIRSIPCWLDPGATRGAINRARNVGDQGAVVGTLIHDYDFVEAGYSLGSLSVPALHKVLTDVRCLPDVSGAHVSAITSNASQSGRQRLQMHVDLSHLCTSSFLGRRFWSKFVQSAYWSPPTLQRLARLAKLMAFGRGPSLKPLMYPIA
jgi:hypothetical protein